VEVSKWNTSCKPSQVTSNYTFSFTILVYKTPFLENSGKGVFYLLDLKRQKKQQNMKILNLSLFILIILCNTLLFPEISFAEYDKGTKFGFFADRELCSNYTIIFNETLNKRIAEIGNRIAKVSDKPDMKYTFRVINTPIVNACSTAGGFVYINTGLLDILETEDELASVIAHEIVHTSENHQINFINSAHSGQVAANVGNSILYGALTMASNVAADSSYFPASNPYEAYQSSNLIGNASSAVCNKLGKLWTMSIESMMIKGYSKDQELEADKLAVRYTKKAGYDPYAMISAFKKLISIRDKLTQSSNNYTSKLINAKPGLEERLKNIEKLIMGR
jgi:predicted Zn-dependent protease